MCGLCCSRASAGRFGLGRFLLGLSPVDAHPVTRRPGTPHTNFACASASAPVTAGSCRSNRPSLALRADPSKRHPPDRFRLRPLSIAHATYADRQGLSRSGASHEVCSPSAHTGRDALSGAAGLRTIPLRRFRQPWPALGPGPPPGARPCGFPPGRIAAMVLVGGGRLREERSSRIRRLCFASPRRRVDGLLLTSRSSSTGRAGASGETVPARSRPIQPPRAPPLRFCRPNRVIAPTRFLARRSATTAARALAA